jgi:predicted house-cleaning NTP pyrophosphatase (Maf/HAM1 superfamily)
VLFSLSRNGIVLLRVGPGKMDVVLASESQFRRRALDLAYEISPRGIDEKSVQDYNPANSKRKLAQA